MKLFDTLLFSFAVLFMLIGLHQAMMVGFAASYWLFMMAIGSLLWYQARRKKRPREPEQNTENKVKTFTPQKKKKYKM
ncbi:MAG TPA: hypothetical protein VK766_11605 [Cytophagaceae bacterium]|jgi:hypothetical protein|nr:hypothetical protein [Cytophagaceae bacterium]